MSLPEGTEWLYASPIESDPTQFDQIADTLEDKQDGVVSDSKAMREVLGEYRSSHKDINIDTIYSEGSKVTRALASMVWGYNVLKVKFRTAASTLRALEDEINEPGGLASLTRQIEQSDGDDLDDDVMAAAWMKYTVLKRKERSALRTLAGSIEEASVGFLADIDNNKTNAILDYLVGELGKYPEASMAIIDDLTVAQMVVADEADGELDADAATYKDLLDQGMSEADVKKIASHERADELAVFDPELAVAVANGDLDFPDDEVKDSVADAQENGLTPGEADLDPLYFPPDYREKAAGIEQLTRQIDATTPTGEPLVGAERRADYVEERHELRRELEGEGKPDGLHEVDAAIATGDYYGDSEWKGTRLGEITADSRVHVGEHRPGLDISGEALDAIATEIEDSGATSSAFFEKFGVENTAQLPTYLAERDPSLVARFSVGLGEASKHRDQEGQRSLSFSGDDVINADIRQHRLGLTPEIIFGEGDFDEVFLGDAIEASVRNRDSSGGSALLDPWEPESENDDDLEGEELEDQEEIDEEIRARREALEARYGSDATNILLDRANENPEAAGRAFDGLAETGDINLLLDPEHEYIPDDSNGGGGYPITEFLGIVGENEDRAGKLLIVANDLEEFPNPGVAAGVDVVMGHHATVMYDQTFLSKHGIEPGDRLSQEEFEALGLSEADWEALQERVLAHGLGSGLIVGHDDLVREAIANDLSEPNRKHGVIDGDYNRFGLTAGVLDRNYSEALIAIAAELDSDNERKNQWSTATGTALSAALGEVPGSSVVLLPADLLVAWFGLDTPFDTDHEIGEISKQLNNTWVEGQRDRFGEMAAIESLRVAEQDGTVILDEEGNKVRFVSGAFDVTTGSPAGDRVERQNENGEWVTVELDDITLETGEGLGGEAGASQGAITVKIQSGHKTGAVAANPNPSAEGSEADQNMVDEAREKVEDKAGRGAKSVWAPLPVLPEDEEDEGWFPWF